MRNLFTLFIVAFLTIGVGMAVALTTNALPSAGAKLVGEIPVSTPTTGRSKPVRAFATGAVEYDGREIVKTDDEWNRLLTPAEFHVMREEGTERAYSGSLLKNKKAGTYHCAACGLAVFASKAKYESNTGWPSFFQPIFPKNVVDKEDKTLPEVRTEVECARCHAHLGHVFDDGPEPTGLRYCMNSVALKFKSAK